MTEKIHIETFFAFIEESSIEQKTELINMIKRLELDDYKDIIESLEPLLR